MIPAPRQKMSFCFPYGQKVFLFLPAFRRVVLPSSLGNFVFSPCPYGRVPDWPVTAGLPVSVSLGVSESLSFCQSAAYAAFSYAQGQSAGHLEDAGASPFDPGFVKFPQSLGPGLSATSTRDVSHRFHIQSEA